MLYYHKRYPNNLSAIQMYHAEFNSDLPKGDYAFLESYCCNPECQCQEVRIEIVKQSSRDIDYFETSDKPIATLRYAWNAPLSEENPSFTQGAYQSEWANAARQVFRDCVEAAPDYNGEFAARFLLMKIQPDYKVDYEAQNKPFVRSVSKLGRNDPCFCESGKKYKNCCLK
jgi:uncharacterized protein YchJ